MIIKEWFLRKNYNSNERYAMSTTDPVIERETEKAYLLKFSTDYGMIKGWFPKSVCEAQLAPASPANVEEGRKYKTLNGLIVKILSVDGLTCKADNGRVYVCNTLAEA